MNQELVVLTLWKQYCRKWWGQHLHRMFQCLYKLSLCFFFFFFCLYSFLENVSYNKLPNANLWILIKSMGFFVDYSFRFQSIRIRSLQRHGEHKVSTTDIATANMLLATVITYRIRQIMFCVPDEELFECW